MLRPQGSHLIPEVSCSEQAVLPACLFAGRGVQFRDPGDGIHRGMLPQYLQGSLQAPLRAPLALSLREASLHAAFIDSLAEIAPAVQLLPKIYSV